MLDGNPKCSSGLGIIAPQMLQSGYESGYKANYPVGLSFLTQGTQRVEWCSRRDSTRDLPLRSGLRRVYVGSHGAEIAYTKYTFQETGTLTDSPQYTTRSEWWQGKTDDNGIPTSAATDYGYTRTIDNILQTETDTVTYPNGLQVATVSDNNQSSISYGKVLNTF